MSKSYGGMMSGINALAFFRDDVRQALQAKLETEVEFSERFNRALHRIEYLVDMDKPIPVRELIGRKRTYSCGNCGYTLTEPQEKFCGNCGSRLDWLNKITTRLM